MVRSLKGKIIDFESMLAREEKTIAVTGGGERMNARGDLINRQGKVLKTREELAENYNTQETSVRNVSLSDRKFGKGMERVIPGTEKRPVTDVKVSATPAATAPQPASKPSYIASQPVQLNDAEFEEVVPKRPAKSTRRLIVPDEGESL
jgi:hypothetical protein